MEKHRQVPLKVVTSDRLGLEPKEVQEGGSAMRFEPREAQHRLCLTQPGPSRSCSTSREGNRARLDLQTHKHQIMALGCTGCPGARKLFPWKQSLTGEMQKDFSHSLGEETISWLLQCQIEETRVRNEMVWSPAGDSLLATWTLTVVASILVIWQG